MINLRPIWEATAMWVENEARRANRNLLAVNGVILAALILTVAANYRYCTNFFLGCKPVASSELASLTSSDQRWRNFVTVTGTKSASTEYRNEVNHMQGDRVVSTEIKDEYFFLLVGEKILLVKAPPGKKQLEYSGELVATTDPVKDDLLRQLATERPDMAQLVLPFTLNADDYRENGYIMLGIGLPLLALALWNCLKAMRRAAEIQTSPVWKGLTAFGNVEQLSYQIEAELQSGVTQKYGKLQVTSQWIVRRNLYSTWVSPVADLVWIYKKVTKHSVNFIPTGKTYAVVLVGSHKQRTEEQMKEKVVNQLLADFAARVPWALFGFNQDIDKAWKKNPGDVINAVNLRHQEYKTKAASAGS
ncbi:MAG TPA: DUF6709 family protein [Candidatus Angelobacter sp.]|nr:DUF6709 family protein [Candidatus Angelobacter sp.]